MTELTILEVLGLFWDIIVASLPLAIWLTIGGFIFMLVTVALASLAENPEFLVFLIILVCIIGLIYFGVGDILGFMWNGVNG